MYEKPFEYKFLRAVESYDPDDLYSCWSRLFSAQQYFYEHLEANGYSSEFAKAVVGNLLSMSTAQVVTFGLAFEGYYSCALYVLRNRDDESVFERAKELMFSPDADERALAAKMLSGKVYEAFEDRIRVLLCDWFEKEEDSVVLESIAYGINAKHIQDCNKILVDKIKHKSWRVRLALSHALTNTHDLDSVNAILELIRDENEEVRNWATFSLKHSVYYFKEEGELESIEFVRDHLFQRLSDSFEEVRFEALAALAMFKDNRILQFIESGLEERPVRTLVLEAAMDFENRALHPKINGLLDEDVYTSSTLHDLKQQYGELFGTG